MANGNTLIILASVGKLLVRNYEANTRNIYFLRLLVEAQNEKFSMFKNIFGLYHKLYQSQA